MRYRVLRWLGAVAGSLALAGGFLTAVLAFGATPAFATGTSITCTYNSTTPSTSPLNALNLNGGSTLTLVCNGSGFTPSSTVSLVTAEISPLAGAAAAENNFNLESDQADIITPFESAPTNASGDIVNYTFTATVTQTGNTSDQFSAPDPSAACPPTQAQVNAGFNTCSFDVSVAAVGGAAAAPMLNVFSGQPSPASPTLALSQGTFTAGNTVGVSDASSPSGFYWGASFLGSPNSSASIPSPIVAFNGTPAGGTGTSGTPGVSVSASTYTNSSCTGLDTPCSSTGTITNPALSGTVTVPSGLSAGSVTVSVTELDTLNPVIAGNGNYGGSGSGSGVTGTATGSYVNTATAAATASPSSGGVGSSISISGTNFNPEQTGCSLKFTTGTDTGSCLVNSSGDLSGSITVGSSEAAGITGPTSDPIIATETVSGGSVSATASFSVLPISSTCSIGPTSGATCKVNQVISGQVFGTDLYLTDVAQGVNPSATNVVLSPVTLGLGAGTNNQQFKNAVGESNIVQVSDDRGTLGGWTVTGQLQTDFSNSTPSGNRQDNFIPADFLTWVPSVALETPGNLPAENANTPFCPTASTAPNASASCTGPSGVPVAASTFTSSLTGSVTGETCPGPILLCAIDVSGTATGTASVGTAAKGSFSGTIDYNTANNTVTGVLTFANGLEVDTVGTVSTSGTTVSMTGTYTLNGTGEGSVTGSFDLSTGAFTSTLDGNAQAGAVGTPGTVSLPTGVHGLIKGTGGISNVPAEVAAGPIAALQNETDINGSASGGKAQTLCFAPSGGGGGGFNCSASLSLAVPPYVSAGSYSSTMDIVVIGF